MCERNVVDGNISHPGVTHRRLEEKLKIVQRADGDLSDEPRVPGVSVQAPNFSKWRVQATKMMNEQLQRADPRAEHVEPEVHAHWSVGTWRGEAGANESSSVTRSTRKRGIYVGVSTGC